MRPPLIDLLDPSISALISNATGFVRDREGRILAWGGGAARLYGFSPSEAAGRAVEEFLGGDVAARAEAERVLASSGSWSGPVRRRTADGRELTVLSQWLPVAAGVLELDVALPGTVEDRFVVGERGGLDLAQAAGRVGTFEWNPTTGYIRFSPEFSAIYGYPYGTMTPSYTAWVRALHPDDRTTVERSLQAAFAARRPAYISEYRINRADGEQRWIEVRSRIDYDADGTPALVTGINLDVTERKRFETRLVEQAEALWRSNRELEQFAYISSHDLKEPLRKIASFSQLLERRIGAHLDEKTHHYLDMIVAGANRMAGLITDLTTYARLERGPARRERVSLNAIIGEVLVEEAPLINERHGRAVVDPLPDVVADPLEMRLLFQNLLSNAFKFTVDRSPRVHVYPVRRKDRLLIGVQDNGPGIEPAYHDRIFKLFQRLHPNGAYSGTGLGLTMSRKIVERHGGRIWVESQPGAGSTFFLSLPLLVEPTA